jgi:S1-C subfamily serine protease
MKKMMLMLWMLMMMGCQRGGEVVIKSGEEIYQGGSDQTVALVQWMGGKLRINCAGVWISDYEIVTAAHCVRDQKKKVLYIKNNEIKGLEVQGRGREAEVVYYDVLRDVSILRSYGDKSHGVAEIRPGLPRIGEEVHIVGHPARMPWSYTHGLVSGYRVDWERFIQVDGAVWYGNSGGGAFDREGRLVGIAVQLTEAPGMAYFTISQDINLAWERSRGIK